MTAEKEDEKRDPGRELVRRKTLAIESYFDDTTPDPGAASLEDQLDDAWFARFLIHENGYDVDDDPIFGPWDELDEAAAVHWRGVAAGLKASAPPAGRAKPKRPGPKRAVKKAAK